MASRILIAGFLGLMCTLTIADDGQLQRELVDQEKRLIDAIMKKDRAQLQEMLADQHFSVDLNYGRMTTPEVLKLLNNVTITDYELSEVKAFPVSSDVGILTYKYEWSGAEGDKPVKGATSYATSTWVKRGGKWKSVFYQETPVER